jgi:tRNA(fMet)-specific endonuclease VapC
VYLIETSTCVSFLRKRLPRAAQRLRELSADGIAVSSITAAELYHGAARSRDPEQEVRRIQSLLEVLPVLDFGSNAAISYGVVRGLLERRGQLIGQFDMLIAGHALSEGATLVTHNTREFQRVAGLLLEDWSN